MGIPQRVSADAARSHAYPSRSTGVMGKKVVQVSEPETFYRGHKIRWSDNSDEWTCYDLSDKVRSSPKLSLIKAAIDRLYLAERKANAVPCFEIGHDGTRTESNVVEYLGAKIQRAWSGGEQRTEHKVAVVATRKGSERPSRREAKLDDLMPSNVDVDAAWLHYQSLRAIEKRAKAAADAALKAIPRLTLDDVTALVELHDREANTQ